MAQLKDWISRSAHSGSFERASSPLGALIGITGVGRTEWVLNWLVKNPEASVVWIEKNLSVLPTALAQRGGGLERILFIELGEVGEWEWTLLTLLRAQLFQAIITPILTPDEQIKKTKDEKSLRRLQLLAEKAQCKVFLLSEVPSQHWTISEQVQT